MHVVARWRAQAAVGCRVTLTCTSRRLPTSITTKTYSTLNPAVTVTKKSQASIAWAWFHTKVLHRSECGPILLPGPLGIWWGTVRGDTRSLSFSKSSAGIRSFSPGRIAPGHLANQLPEIRWEARPTAGTRAPPPEEPESLPVPADKRLGLHNDERFFPGEEPRQKHQPHSGRIACPPWTHLPLLVERQLPS
jgi:hypothetical protein